MEKKQITLPEDIVIVLDQDSKGKPYTERETIVPIGELVHFDTVEGEMAIYEMKADILATVRNIQLIIEICYRHKVDDQKLLKMVKNKISAIEIDLSNLKPEDIQDWETFWTFLNDPNRIKWLHNTKSHDVRKKLKDKVKKKIQVQERIYKQEEAQKRKKEQKEKERLSQALNELQILLADNEYMTSLKREAETHPVWKNARKHLPFSWHNLPTFLNVDAPNGDWIFGCDRRVWQTAFYNYFIEYMHVKKNEEASICTRNIDKWLQDTVGCKVPHCAKIVGIYGRKYCQLVPNDIWKNLPSSWRTLNTYFWHLCDLGILEYSRDDWKSPGNQWFKIIGKEPKQKNVTSS